MASAISFIALKLLSAEAMAVMWGTKLAPWPEWRHQNSTKLIRRKPLKHVSLVREREKSRFDQGKFCEERGLILTICIAGVTLSGDIVAVSDTMVSFDDQIQADEFGAIKHFRLCPGWGIMFATNYITRVQPIVDGASRRLNGVQECAADLVQAAACEAYCDAVNEETTKRYLWPLGIKSLREFREIGLAQFGARTFSQIRRKIEKFNLGVQLLIIGFDPVTDRAHIFEIDNPGICSDHRNPGYWAIGSGTAMALASITSRPLGVFVEEILFQLCEAKFSAETASGVGKFTLAVVMDKNGDILPLLGEDVENLRKIWKDRTTAPPPAKALRLIRTQLTRNRVRMPPRE